jgi:hypothetical protein
VRVAWVLIVVASASACGSSGGGEDAMPDAEDTSGFCSGWSDALLSDSPERYLDVLDDPPNEVADEAAVLIREIDSEDSEAGNAAYSAVTQWVDVNCEPDAAKPDATGADRRVAPLPDTEFEGLTFCSAGRGLSIPPGSDHLVIYGDTSHSDPYAGPMLAVAWGRQGGYDGDGAPTPVAVRGTEGVAAPISVFQQVVLDDLGTVIAWDEGDDPVGLYGRLWDESRTDELVAFADALVVENGSFSLPTEAMPDGYEEVYSGSSDPMSLAFTPGAAYAVRYMGEGDDGAPLTIDGFVASPEDFEAVRFLAAGLEPTTVANHEALAGYAWGERGPAVVTWREPDGLVVRLLGLGHDLDAVETIADATRELTRAEWVDLIETPDDCPAPGP